MNCYTDRFKSKFFCKDSIIKKGLTFNMETVEGKDYLINNIDSTLKSLLHRIGGPAIIHYQSSFWYYEGKIHRENGPAFKVGNDLFRWFYHGEEILCKDNEEFLKIFSMKAFI